MASAWRDGPYAASTAPDPAIARIIAIDLSHGRAGRRGAGSQWNTTGAIRGKKPTGPLISTAATIAKPAPRPRAIAPGPDTPAPLPLIRKRIAVLVSSACWFSSMLLTTAHVTI